MRVGGGEVGWAGSQRILKAMLERGTHVESCVQAVDPSFKKKFFSIMVNYRILNIVPCTIQ